MQAASIKANSHFVTSMSHQRIPDEREREREREGIRQTGEIFRASHLLMIPDV